MLTDPPSFPSPRGRPPPSVSKRGFLCIRYQSQWTRWLITASLFHIAAHHPPCSRSKQDRELTGKAQAELPEVRPYEASGMNVKPRLLGNRRQANTEGR